MILTVRDPVVREFLLAFWKIHILHHAGERGVYGQWMLEELDHHGYRLSPGTLYPILARMAARGWLRSSEPARSRGTTGVPFDAARSQSARPDSQRARRAVSRGERQYSRGRWTNHAAANGAPASADTAPARAGRAKQAAAGGRSEQARPSGSLEPPNWNLRTSASATLTADGRENILRIS